jgi:hypothetical protein
MQSIQSSGNTLGHSLKQADSADDKSASNTMTNVGADVVSPSPAAIAQHENTSETTETEEELMKRFVERSLEGTSGQRSSVVAASQQDQSSTESHSRFMKDFRTGAELALKHGEEEAAEIKKQLAVANRKAEIARRRAAFNTSVNSENAY